MKKILTCTYSGEKGAYAEMAVKNYFGDKVEPISVNGFEEIFVSVVEGKCD